MIRLTRISHAPVVLNSDLIEHIESTPDTVISLTTGQKVVVLETTDEVIRRVIEFRRLVAGTAGCVLAQEASARRILHRAGTVESECEADAAKADQVVDAVRAVRGKQEP